MTLCAQRNHSGIGRTPGIPESRWSVVRPSFAHLKDSTPRVPVYCCTAIFQSRSPRQLRLQGVKNGGLARSRPHLRCPQHPSKRTLRDGFKGLFRAKAVIGSPSFDRLGMLHCSDSGTQLAKGCAQW
jgi:hypothetical protein